MFLSKKKILSTKIIVLETNIYKVQYDMKNAIHNLTFKQLAVTT